MNLCHKCYTFYLHNTLYLHVCVWIHNNGAYMHILLTWSPSRCCIIWVKSPLQRMLAQSDMTGNGPEKLFSFLFFQCWSFFHTMRELCDYMGHGEMGGVNRIRKLGKFSFIIKSSENFGGAGSKGSWQRKLRAVARWCQHMFQHQSKCLWKLLAYIFSQPFCKKYLFYRCWHFFLTSIFDGFSPSWIRISMKPNSDPGFTAVNLFPIFAL